MDQAERIQTPTGKPPAQTQGQLPFGLLASEPSITYGAQGLFWPIYRNVIGRAWVSIINTSFTMFLMMLASCHTVTLSFQHIRSVICFLV